MSPRIRSDPSDSEYVMGRDCSGCPVRTTGESSDCDSGIDDLSPLDAPRGGLSYAKSWPLNSPFHLQQVQKATQSLESTCTRRKSIRFADSFGLPLVSVLHYRQHETVEEFGDGIRVSLLGGAGGAWSSARSVMEHRWSFEDDLEMSLSASRRGSGCRAKADSWDLPSNMKLRRAPAPSKTKSKLTQASGSAAHDAEKASHSSPPPKLVLDGFDKSAVQTCLSERNVALEYVTFQDYSLFGSVLVKNIAFEKNIAVHYTLDGWTTSADLHATYVTGSTAADGSTDRFSFTFVYPSSTIGASGTQAPVMEFAICYKTSSGEFWDSNGGRNYRITVPAK